MSKQAIAITVAVLVVISATAIVLIATGNGVTDLAIAPKYEEALPFHDGLAVVKLDGKYGAVNEKGVFVVEPRFQWLGDFNEGYAAALNFEGEMQIVHAETDTAATPTYSMRYLDYGTDENGESSITEKTDVIPVKATPEELDQDRMSNMCYEGIISLNGIPFRTDGTPLLDVMGAYDEMAGPCVGGIIPVRWVSDVGPFGVTHYDKSGLRLREVQFGYSNIALGYAPRDGRIVFTVADSYTGETKTGLMDENGVVLLLPTYDGFRYLSDGTFFTNGRMIVQKEGKFGAIDRDGNEVIPCTYDFLGGFSEGYCFAIKNGEGYFIDPEENRYDIRGIDGAETSVTAAAYFNAQGVGVVYDSISKKTFCLTSQLTDGAFTAIPGTEELNIRSFIRDYEEGMEVKQVSSIADNGLFPYEKDGKWGYLKLIVNE